MKARYLLYSLSILCTLVFSSCERDEIEKLSVGDEDVDQMLVPVPSKFLVTPFGTLNGDSTDVKSEVYNSNEMQIKDFWLIQFDDKGDLLASVYHDSDANGTLLTNYVRMDNNNSNISKTKTVWIVANTGDATGLSKNNLETQLSSSREMMRLDDGVSDLEVFEKDGYRFTTNSLSTIVSLNRTDGAILMSGKCNFDASDLYYSDGKPNYTSSAKGLVVSLKSIVAKLTINYEIESGYSLNTIKLFRIPDRVSFAGDEVRRTDYLSLPYEYTIPNSGTTAYDGSMTLYLPRNMQPKPEFSGTWDARSKTLNSPVKATYISFGLTRTSDNKTVSVNVFPGGDSDNSVNQYDNYNLCSNAHYVEDVKITASTVNSYLLDNINYTDSRLIEKLRQDITSNCYILNPLTGKGSVASGFNYSKIREEYYSLPVVARVNEGWSVQSDSPNSIGAGDEWKMEVIWQDVPGRQVYFAESSGLKAWRNEYGFIQNYGSDSGNNGNYAHEYFGKGSGDNGYVNIYVRKECTQANSARTQGNVLIGLRKKTGTDGAGNNVYGEIIWSWHLWITDYNPDSAGKWTSGYMMSVPGDADNDETKDANVFHYRYWADDSYDWIMDRHLGALGWRPMNVAGGDDFSSFGMYYQWGRKDPFPAQRLLDHGSTISNIQLYDIKGNVSSRHIQSNTSETGDIWKATNFPYILYGVDLIATYPGDIYNWNHPGTSVPRQGTKSIFDPCPVGWEVPETAAYAGMVTLYNSTTVNSNYSNDDYTSFNKGDDTNEKAGTVTQLQVNDGAWIVDAFGTSSGSHYSYFPCSGWLGAGGSKDMQGIGDIWCADQKSNTIASFLYIGYGVEVNNNNFTREGKTPAIVLKAGGETSTYFNKRHGFSVRCVKKTKN